MFDAGVIMIHTHRHYICGGVGCLLIIVVDLPIRGAKGGGKPLVFCMISPSRPCLVKGFEGGDGKMKCWGFFEGKCMLGIIGMLTSCSVRLEILRNESTHAQ
jgi:hypothetical protein